MATANQVLSIAAGEIGYNRYNDPETGTKYGRWYEATIDRDSTNYNFGGNGVPYCFMFVSWVLNQAGATCVGAPCAYCPSGVAAARSKGVLRAASTAKPGDVVFFDWEGDGISDHVGFVEKNLGGSLQCIEGNTNGGQVARRTRSNSTVIGVVTPNYDGVVSAPTSSNDSTNQANQVVQDNVNLNSIAVDGLWGCATTRELQKALGTPQDGLVSNQHVAYRDYNPGLMSSSWQWTSNPGNGSEMVRAIQGRVGTNGDGLIGPKTIRGLQRYLGTEEDGHISRPSACVRALQARLNNGGF